MIICENLFMKLSFLLIEKFYLVEDVDKNLLKFYYTA